VPVSVTVPSYPDREAVLAAARHTPGVGAVEDRLWIDPAA
jgi:hypothetical protein